MDTPRQANVRIMNIRRSNQKLPNDSSPIRPPRWWASILLRPSGDEAKHYFWVSTPAATGTSTEPAGR
jgi:hypothetical protein